MNNLKNTSPQKSVSQNLHISRHFEEIVNTFPDTTALIYEDQLLTYEMLNKKSNQLARQIRKKYHSKVGQELTSDVIIALYLDRSLDMIIAILAVLKAGGAYVPIDPSYPKQRVDYIIDDTGAEIILCQHHLQEDKQIEFPREKTIFVESGENFYLYEDSSNLQEASQPTDLAYVIYTSGSSGKPKGVMVEHQQVVSFSKGNNFIDENKVQTVAGISNYAFDGSIFDIFFSLLNGKKLVIFSQQSLFDLSLFNSYFLKHNIDTAFLTTALFNSLVTNQLKCLKIVKQLLFGGEAANLSIVNTFKSTFPETELIHVYGPTETIVYASYCNLAHYKTDDKTPIGTPLADKKLYLLDQFLKPILIGEIGELYIGGSGLARGYLNNTPLTEEKFIVVPFISGEENESGPLRLYKTGDLVRRLPDGNIEFIGRNDEQVKIRGFRIELSEIEQTLQQIPGIKESRVLVKERVTDSGIHQYIAAYYILDQHSTAGNDTMVLDSWEDLYDSSVYDKTSGEVEVGSDFSGWNSYITGQPIPLSEMEAWRKNILSVILGLNPINVLEIGVGSGLFMYPLLKDVQTFTGIDISSAIIKRHQEVLKEKSNEVKLYHLKAHEIDNLPGNKTYDTIVLNSVAQHFPNIGYFEEVIEKALDKLSPNGSLFIGDISNYEVQKEMIREKLHFHKIDYTEEELQKMLLKENHLLISPGYFTSIQEKYKNIEVKILSRKTTDYTNELSTYRYDVVITQQKQKDSTHKAMNLPVEDHDTHLYNVPFINQLSKDDIIRQLSKELPEYMLPSSFVSLESFPLNGNGKLDKNRLPEPDINNLDGYVSPTTDTEITVCTIWQEVLGINNIGISDDFFKLGGNSILAIRASHRMSNALHIELKAADVFKYRTISQLISHTLGQTQVVISRNHSDQAPLSFAQERLWFIEEFEEGTSLYHIPIVYELGENTDPEGIHYALRQIVARHEVLRTTIQGDVQRAIQVVHQEALPIEEVTLSYSDNLSSLLAEDIKRPFDLRKEYPLRIKLYNRPSGSSESKGKAYTTVLLINMHHIASDGWSIQIFHRELFAYYRAFIENNKDFSLPETDIQYKDYALWQKKQLTGEALEKELGYWKKKLSGYQTLALPTDFPRPERKDYAGASKPFTFTKEMSDRLRDLAKKHRTTIHSVMLAGINILLGKYTGQNDIIVGSPIANRQHRQTQDLIGFFVNSQVNRTQLSSGQSYHELIQEGHQQQINAQAYQDLPFEKLVEELGIERDLSRHAVFQVMFVVQSFGIKVSQEQNGLLLPFGGIIPDETEKFDMTIFIDDSCEEITGKISFATSLFKEQTIEALIGHYTKLTDLITQQPEKAYSEIGLLTTEEHHKIVHTWNATDTAYPTETTIHSLFEGNAKLNPERTALVSEELQLTYAQFNEKSNQLARHIREQYRQRTGSELKPDTLIALLADRSPEAIIAMFAVLKAGGAYVPIDPSYPQQRIDFILQDTDAQLVLSQRKLHRERQPDSFSRKVVYIDLMEDLYHGDASDLPRHSTPHDLAYVLYTSGTTGEPKGVMIEHRSLANLIFSQRNRLRIDTSSNMLQYAALVFDVSVWEIFSALSFGAQLSIIPASAKQDSRLLNEYISKEKITIAEIPPILLNVMPDNELPELKILVVGGDVSSIKVMQQWSQNRKLINAYGPTEATVNASMHVYSEGDLNTNIGKPIENVKLYILDSDRNPVPPGVTGELYIAGAGLARGYFNNTKLTEERFINNPFTSEEGKKMYRTGDLARWLPNGDVEFLGRNDDQVKVNGFRIELGEIEHAVQTIPGIKQCRVLTRVRQTGIGTSKYLVAYYVPQGKAVPDKNHIHQILSEKLPDYMLPVLVAMDALPLTVNGKLDKKALPDPDFTGEDHHIPPATELEHELCNIWVDVLQVKSIGVTDNFFKVGGNSILAIQASHRMSEAMGTEIKIADLFILKTIRKLLEKIS